MLPSAVTIPESNQLVGSFPGTFDGDFINWEALTIEQTNSVFSALCGVVFSSNAIGVFFFNGVVFEFDMFLKLKHSVMKCSSIKSICDTLLPLILKWIT